MTPTNTPLWPTLLTLRPDPTLTNNHTYQGLHRGLHLTPQPDHTYTLTCQTLGLPLNIPLGHIRHKQIDETHPHNLYNPHQTYQHLQQAHQTQPPFHHFLHYSPWLLPHLNLPSGDLDNHLRGIIIVRLTHHLLRLLEENPIASHNTPTYHLLQRLHYLTLAQLTHTPNIQDYLPTHPTDLSQAWQTWGNHLIQHPHTTAHLLVRYQTNIETEGQRLLTQPNNTHWLHTQQKHNLPYTNHLLTHWYLPRYDLQTVQQTLPAPIRLLHHPLLTLTTLLLLLLPTFADLLLPTPPLLFIKFSLIVATLTLLTSLPTLLGNHTPYTQPRITLAIIVGYLGLISSSELLNLALLLPQQPTYYTLSLIILSLLMAFAAIHIEVRRYISGRIAICRTLRVLLLATTRALTIGWLLLAPIGSLLLHSLTTPSTPTWLTPLPTPLYPQLLLLTPLALFIGLFIQTIWEGNPLTQPLKL